MATNAGYAASQNKRWQEANKTGDKDLQRRLQADSKRVGYTLNPYQQAVQTATKTATQQPVVKSTTPAATVTPSFNNNSITGITQSPTRQTIDRFDQGTQQKFNFTAPEAFTYDYNTDPSYQAALQSAQRNIATQQNDTNAVLRGQGQGKSSYSETLANQIGAREMGRISSEVIPQLAQQAYQRYSDQANRNMQVQQANYGVSQDNLNNVSRLYALQDQEFFQNPMSEANLTGQYLSGEARGYINAINQLKSQAEQPGVTGNALAALSSEADSYRRALQGLGVDSTLFGADVNLQTAQGNLPRAGVRTLQGQNMDEGIRQYNQNFDYGQTRDSVADAQYQQELARALANDANSRSLGWANHNLSSQREGRLAAQEQAAAAAQGSSSGGGGQTYSAATTSNYKYTEDPNFFSSLKTINNSNERTLNTLYEDMLSNPDVYAQQFGFNGYEELIKQVQGRQKFYTDKNKSNDPLANFRIVQ